MNRLNSTLLAAIAISVVTLAAPLTKQLQAQSAPQPAVVISIADYDSQMADVDYLLEAAGYEQMKFMVKAMVNPYAQGLATDSPIGALLYFTEGQQEPDVLGFVRTTDLEAVLDTIAKVAEVDEGDEYTTVVTDDGTEMMIKQVDDIAFVSNNPETFNALPADPFAELGTLKTKYNLAAQVFAQRVPKAMRDQVLEMVREGYQDQMDQSGVDEDDFQRKNFELSMKQFSVWINETEDIIVGMAADKDSESLYTDFELRAVKGSSLAERMAAMGKTQPSSFLGFLMDGAAFTHHSCLQLHPEEAAQSAEMLEGAQDSMVKAMKESGDLDEEQMKVAEKAIGDIVTIVKETLAEGLFNSGAVVMLEEGNVNLATALHLADPQKLENVVKDLVAYAETQWPDEFQVDLNSGSHQGVTFHHILLTVPDDFEEFRDAVGDQVTIVVGIGAKDAYFGVGNNPLPLIKQAMDGGGTKQEAVFEYNGYLAPIMKFAAGIEGEPAIGAMAAELEANGKDRIGMKSFLIENGMKTRMEMQDGILALIKVGIEGAQQQFQLQENDF